MLAGIDLSRNRMKLEYLEESYLQLRARSTESRPTYIDRWGVLDELWASMNPTSLPKENNTMVFHQFVILVQQEAESPLCVNRTPKENRFFWGRKEGQS